MLCARSDLTECSMVHLMMTTQWFHIHLNTSEEDLQDDCSFQHECNDAVRSLGPIFSWSFVVHVRGGTLLEFLAFSEPHPSLFVWLRYIVCLCVFTCVCVCCVAEKPTSDSREDAPRPSTIARHRSLRVWSLTSEERPWGHLDYIVVRHLFVPQIFDFPLTSSEVTKTKG